MGGGLCQGCVPKRGGRSAATANQGSGGATPLRLDGTRGYMKGRGGGDGQRTTLAHLDQSKIRARFKVQACSAARFTG